MRLALPKIANHPLLNITPSFFPQQQFFQYDVHQIHQKQPTFLRSPLPGNQLLWNVYYMFSSFLIKG